MPSLRPREKAIEYLLKYLQRKPDALDVRWMLNLAYMTLGKYPAGVPPQYLTPPTIFDSAEDVGRFVDVAPAAGINLYSMSGGLIVDDFERNGLFDIVTSDYGQCAPMHYFHNNGDGTFADHTAQAGLADQLGGLNLIQTDYNNDGCLDILVLRGAWEFPAAPVSAAQQLRRHFHRRNRTPAACNLPMQTQTGSGPTSTTTAISICSSATKTGPAISSATKATARLKTSRMPPVSIALAFTKGVVAADYDNDGYVDFYVSNLNGDNFLYHNNHNGHLY